MSMTGFARTDGGAEAVPEAGGAPIAWTWAWEIRSVNSKGLDLRCRLPALVEAWESRIRERLQARLSRGSGSITLTLEPADTGAPSHVLLMKALRASVLASLGRLGGSGRGVQQA